ncbi:hypothetical protein SynPROS91_01995 [Synechococcus sp. PROS-9-1]|nr:hypothetical protein SynPROS91_01995 [Synechococcus sp. PROS-9-1]
MFDKHQRETAKRHDPKARDLVFTNGPGQGSAMRESERSPEIS